ncbi:PGN_0703 family putative restriction endonuclease [Paraburkholderia sp. EG304]|uniref:PGN_0703 family putative restriction endonuclease n=1 Tax=Paraburkholderia sp. EG304 TaxID=3237015 RepID=UPI00397AA208
MQHNRPPLVPISILKAHKVYEPSDSRFMAAARLLQALWREEKGLSIGTHRNAKGKRYRLGSRLDTKSAEAGGNFLSPDIAQLALRESVYCEIGAIIEQERLWKNLLSSQPLCFNLFGGMKLDIEKGNRFFRSLFADYVESIDGIYFEHSPGRGKPAYTNDYTAFDVFVPCTTIHGGNGFVAIEVKYSETMAEPLLTLRKRYAQLSRTSGIYRDPEALALRASPLQQLWREHLLCHSMIDNGAYSSGRYVLMHPRQNVHCTGAVNAYQRQLLSQGPETIKFLPVTLEDCVETLRAIGEGDTASAFHHRYLDFERVERTIFRHRIAAEDGPPG